MTVIPVHFVKEHRKMLAHAKKILEYNNGTIAINPRFDKLITSLRTAVEKGEGSLDKEATSYDELQVMTTYLMHSDWYCSFIISNEFC
jgi:hypothetical protein